MTLPDLHGWLPASALARREGVSPSTIRRRAARGAYEVIRNPLGPGALYLATDATRATTPETGGVAEQTRENSPSGRISGLRSDDGYALTALPASAPHLATLLGLTRGTAHRTLRRLERAGLATPDGQLASGPRGGRPRRVYRAL